MKEITGILFLLILIHQLNGQEKREMERDVKKREVPSPAVDWMHDAYEKAGKIKWYYQEDGSDISYEAKLRWQEKRHSVEFDTLGRIIDLEIEIDWDDLPSEIRMALKSHFDAHYQKWEILKVQQQWVGDPDDLEDLIDEQEVENLTIRYEIEYRGQTEEEDELWEGLFDHNGKQVEKRKIILGNLNNLTY